MEALLLLVLLVVVVGPLVLAVGLMSARSRLAVLERRLNDDHSRRLVRLENQVREMWESRKAAGPPADAPTPTATPREAPPEPEPAGDRGEVHIQPAPPPPAPAPPRQPERPAASGPSARPSPPPQPAPVVTAPAGGSNAMDAFASGVRAWLLGGNTVVRVGMVVVLFGVAFFLKYAFDQGWVPIEIRLMAAAAAGLGLTGLGWRLRETRPDYARVVQGGGVGIVYLTVFASTNLYDMIGSGAAIVLMVVLVALASALSVLQNARSLAVLAAVGGFLAPVLVSSGGSHVSLFAYYLVLDLGIVGIAWFRAWRVLNLLGFVFTFGIGSVWGASYYQPEFFRTTEPFLIAFFLLYIAIPILFAARTAGSDEGSVTPGKGLVDGSLVFGTPLVGFGLQSVLVGEFEYGRALSALGAGILYAVLATRLWRRRSPRFGFLVEIFVSLAVAFGTLAIPLALDARWTGAAWALEGAGLVWVGNRQRQVLAWLAGLAMQLAAAGAFFVSLALTPTPDLAIANGIFLGAALLALAGFSSAWHLRRDSPEFSAAALAWGLVWWFGAGFNEVATFVSGDGRLHADLLFTTGSLAAAGALRFRLIWRALIFPVIGLLPAMVWVALGLFATDEHPFSPMGLVTWAAAFTAHLWLLRRVDETPDWLPGLIRAWHVGTLWLAVFLTSWEVSWVLDEVSGSRPTWQVVSWILIPVATIAGVPALVRRAERGTGPAWPLASHARTYRSALWLPALVTALWIVYASFRAGDPSPLPYVPIFNPLVIVQVLALIVVVRWVRSLPADAALRDLLPASRLGPAVGVIGFIVLNGVIARATHLYGAVPFRIDALWESATYQTIASITWTLAALVVMVTATRWRRRAVWGTGATLLGLVVVKLFLVDLAGLETVARIVSFLVVGSLILLIGYLSPLPPRAPERRAESRALGKAMEDVHED